MPEMFSQQNHISLCEVFIMYVLHVYIIIPPVSDSNSTEVSALVMC